MSSNTKILLALLLKLLCCKTIWPLFGGHKRDWSKVFLVAKLFGIRRQDNGVFNSLVQQHASNARHVKQWRQTHLGHLIGDRRQGRFKRRRLWRLVFLLERYAPQERGDSFVRRGQVCYRLRSRFRLVEAPALCTVGADGFAWESRLLLSGGQWRLSCGVVSGVAVVSGVVAAADYRKRRWSTEIKANKHDECPVPCLKVVFLLSQFCYKRLFWHFKQKSMLQQCIMWFYFCKTSILKLTLIQF